MSEPEQPKNSGDPKAARDKRLEAILESISGYQSTATMDAMMDEIASYQVELAPDPTLPHLGNKYLQEKISTCREYLNRAQFYLQQLRRYEKGVRLKLRERELDLDLKVKGKLADDQLVRKQPAIADRLALAASLLLEEHEDMAGLKVVHLDVENTIKLLKFAYDHLSKTSQDIRLQRQMVKDDKEILDGGGNGYNRPTPKQDGTMANGMPVPAAPPPDPTDLLDPSKRPDDMPSPIDGSHAKLMAEFLKSHPERPSKSVEKPVEVPIPVKEPDPPTSALSYDDLLK